MKRQYLIMLVLTIFLLLFLIACGGEEPVIQPTGSTHEDPQRESSAGKVASEADPALKQETAKSLLEKILSSDFLWQSAEQSGSVFFGPYKQWREKLPELCELETREDAPELLLQEYAYLMEDFYEKPRDLSTPAQRYRSTAVITILYQPCFLDKLPKEQRESFIIIAEGTAKTAEEGEDLIQKAPPLFFIVRNKEESDNIDEYFRNQYIDLLHFFLMPDDKEFCTKVILFHPDTATLEGSFRVEGEKWFISISVKNVGNMDEYVKECEQKYGVKLKTMDTNDLGTVYILPVESDFHCYYFEKNNKVCCISTVDLPWEQSDELVRNITLVPFSWE